MISRKGAKIMIKIGDTEYRTYDRAWREQVLTSEEHAELQLKVEIIGKIIEAREKLGITQKALADLCGYKQPFIARIEKGETDPQLTSILKVLEPLGYTLKVVPKTPRKLVYKDRIIDSKGNAIRARGKVNQNLIKT
jgi:DNA-binding XRE family transcriptional regulator